MKDALKIIGAHGHRHENDFYPTPPECTVALLDFLEERALLRSTDTIWEPACGNGAMVNVMKERVAQVIATDLSTDHDYMETDFSYLADWIITNPPFSLAKEFIERSLTLGRPFALLLKSQFWHSAKRLPLFNKNRPAFVCPMTWRPDFTGKGSSMLDMMWCIWIGENSPITIYHPIAKPKGDHK